MVIKLKCFDGADPADLVPVMAALAEAVHRVDVPHGRLGAVLDWVQYRRNFRDVVEVRRFVGSASPFAEIAIDVRRAKDLEAPALAAAIVERFADRAPHARVVLERWAASSESIIWAFNATYWRHLSAWGTTFDKHFAAALPGGVSDGTNPPRPTSNRAMCSSQSRTGLGYTSRRWLSRASPRPSTCCIPRAC
jgi:hypothetical protein